MVNHEVAQDAAVDSTGEVLMLDTEDEPYLGAYGYNIGGSPDVLVEVSPNGENWFLKANHDAVSEFADDNLRSSARYIRVRVDTAGSAGSTGTFELQTKAGST